MKFSKILTTFKNGLCSPLMRGRTDIQGIESSAEEFLNNYIDSTGSSIRRPPLKDVTLPPNASFDISYIDGQPENIQTFGFTILGRELVFAFDTSKVFNDQSAANAVLADPVRRSTFLSIVTGDNSGAAYPVQVFGGGEDFSSEALQRLRVFNTASVVGPPTTQSTGLSEYLGKNLKILNATQVSDRTVVFTTDYFSFCVSLVTIKAENSDYLVDNAISNKFIMYPYFVNLSMLVQNPVGIVEYKCPILPINYSFNTVNTDPTAKVTVTRYATLKAQPASGVLYDSGKGFAHQVAIPVKSHNSDYEYFAGAFIRVTTQDSKDAVFFLTRRLQQAVVNGITCQVYDAIGCVAGDPPVAGTASWTISAWNDALGYPKVNTTYKSRLLFANSGKELSAHPWGGDGANTIWAAALNKNSPFDFQGMMADTLIQDAGVADSSGMNYYNSANAAQRGFSLAFSDGDGEEIRWMSPKKRLHIGTSKGEYQITVNATFDRDSADQSKIGSISSDFIQPTQGDRKILYCANGGREMRFISVIDKDYESVDGKLNAVLSGLNIVAAKLVWFEKLRLLLVVTTIKEIYALSLDSLLEVSGFSLWKFSFDIADVCATNNSAFFIYKDAGSYKLAELNVDDVDSNIHLDFGVTPYKSRVRSLPIEGGSQFGSSVGDVIRVDRATIQVFDSGNFYYGSEDGRLYKTENLADGITITKNYTLDFPQSPDREQFIIIETEASTPLNISGVALRGVGYQGE